jgi:hypothetical protein
MKSYAKKNPTLQAIFFLTSQVAVKKTERAGLSWRYLRGGLGPLNNQPVWKMLTGEFFVANSFFSDLS